MHDMKPPHRLLVVVAVAASLLVAVGASGSAGARDAGRSPRLMVKTRIIAPGLVYTKIVEKKVPRRTFVLQMDPAQPITLDVALAQSALPARRVLSDRKSTRLNSSHSRASRMPSSA